MASKDRVTGKIGEERVELENAATEATLSSLLEAFEKMSKARGETLDDIKKKKEQTKKYAEAQNNATEATKSFEEAAKNATSVFDGMLSGLTSLAGAVASLPGLFLGAAGAATALTVGFMQSGDRLSDIITTDILFLGDLADALDNNIDRFREMAGVGATFGNSLLETRLAAANARLSLRQFSDLVRDNSETLAIFGSTTQSGARAFSRLSKQLIDGDIGQKLQGMGFTVEGINEGLANYIEIQARNNRLERRNTDQLIQGTRNYLEEVDALARITGMERKEAQQAMLASQEEAKFRNQRARLESDEARTRFDANLAFMDQLGPMGDVLKDLSDGAAQTEEAQYAMSVLGPRIMDIAQRAARADLDPEQLRNELSSVAGAGNRFVNILDDAAFQSLPPAMSGVLNSLMSLNRLNEDAIELTEEEQANRNIITEALGSFQRTVRAVKETLMAGFLESRIFEDLSGGLEDFSEYFTTERVTDFFDSLVDSLSWVNTWYSRAKNAMSDFLYNMETKGLGAALKEAAVDLVKELKTFMFGGEITRRVPRGPNQPGDMEVTEVREGMLNKFAEGFSNWYDTSGLKDVFQRMAKDIVGFFADFIFGRQLTEEEKFTEEQRRRRNELATIPSFRRTEEEKAEFQRLEERQKHNEAVQKGLQGFIPGFKGRGETADDLFGAIINQLDYTFRTGSNGVKDFGSGSPAMLHGREAVLTEEQLFRMANGAYGMGTQQMSQARISSAISSAFESGSSIATNINQRQLDKLPNTMRELKTAIQDLKPEADRTAEQPVRTSDDNQTELATKLDQLNSTMNEVAAILYNTHDVSKRQLNTTRSMTGNMMRGAPV